MHSAHVVAERFFRNLKTKTYKYITSILKNVYINKLEDIVNEYNNTYQSTIKMKPFNVKWSTYTDFHVRTNNKGRKFKVGHHLVISKYRNIFPKAYTPNWTEDLN